jgi:hypothetical protein
VEYGEQFRDQMMPHFLRGMARDAPGRGAELPDDPEASATNLRTRSIPNVPTERLRRHLEHLHAQVHTEEGLRQLDEPRRNIVHKAMKAKVTAHELRLRGEPTGECSLCWHNTMRHT